MKVLHFSDTFCYNVLIYFNGFQSFAVFKTGEKVEHCREVG